MVLFIFQLVPTQVARSLGAALPMPNPFSGRGGDTTASYHIFDVKECDAVAQVTQPHDQRICAAWTAPAVRLASVARGMSFAQPEPGNRHRGTRPSGHLPSRRPNLAHVTPRAPRRGRAHRERGDETRRRALRAPPSTSLEERRGGHSENDAGRCLPRPHGLPAGGGAGPPA